MASNRLTVSVVLSFLLKWTFRFIIALILLVALSSLLLQLPFVQKKVATWTTNYLSEKTGATVSIKSVDVSIFDGFNIEKFTIVDGKDTVLMAGALNAKLSNSLFTLANNSLDVKSIELEDSRLNLIKEKSTGKINLFRILGKLSGPDDGSKKEKLNLNLKDINLSRVYVNYFDEMSNAKSDAYLDLGTIKVNFMNINKNEFDVEKIKLYKPVINMYAGSNQVAKVVNSGDKNLKIQDKSTFCINLNSLLIEDGKFSNNSSSKQIYKSLTHFNPKDFKVEDLNFEINKFVIDTETEAKIESINTSLKFINGIELKNLSLNKIVFTENEFDINRLELLTEKTYLKNSFNVSYSSVKELMSIDRNTIVNTGLVESKIAFSDIEYFVPSLNKSSFYKSNSKEVLNIDGTLYGKMSNLKGKNLMLSLGKKLNFIGNFGIKNLNVFPESFINLNVDEMKMDVNFLKEVIPNFNPPQNFYTLGKIKFNGRFDGFVEDFVVNGKMLTDLGNANLDLRLDVKDGSEKASYSGQLALINFDLKKWSGGNPDLGLVSLNAKIKDGKSLLLKTASAELVGDISKFEYKNYNYSGVKLDGKLSPKEFKGLLSSKDTNINFDFDGNINFESSPKFDFKSKIVNIDLSKLNLSKDVKTIKGNIDFSGTGTNLNDIVGKLTTSDLYIEKNDTVYYFKEASLVSKLNTDGSKNLKFDSDRVKVLLDGKYDFNTIVDDVSSIIKNNYEYHTRDWKYVPKPISPNQNFKFDIDVDDPHTLLDIAGVKDVNVRNIKAKGSLNTPNSELNFIGSVPFFAIKSDQVHNLKLIVNSKGKSGNLLIHVDSSLVSNNKLYGVDLQFILKNNVVDFLIESPKLTDSIQNVYLKGSMVPHPKGYTFMVSNNDLRIFNRRWKINNASKISLGKEFIDISNLQITDGQRSIEVDDYNNQGIVLKLDKVDLVSINPLLKYEKIQFSGELSSNVTVNNIFIKSPSVSGNLVIPSLLLNGENFGEMTLDVSKAVDKPVDAILSISNKVTGQALKVNAKYDIDTKYLNAEVKSKKLSLKWLEFILSKGIKDLKGDVDLEARVLGPITDLRIDGDAVANNGSVKVIYLGETYSFDKQPFKVTHNVIDLTGAKLKDSQGNEGEITGVMRHNLFKAFSLDVSIYGANVIAIKTGKYDNPIYYGLGRGELTVDFIGSVDDPLMKINAVTKAGTKINIPIQESKSTSEKSFINYIDKETFYNKNKDTSISVKQVKVEGLSIEMNLTITEDAEVNLIFDESKNDIINGFGRGNIKMSMSNKGEFDMFGTYTVSRGQYLFTALNIVNKPFVIREGGTIRWTGDPINASINIAADYPVRTSLTNFLSEYTFSEQLKQSASLAQDVNLNLLIGNTLYNPSVKFNFDFPNLTGELKTYADTKLRLLRNNEVEFNSQVFGLVVFNSFMPSSTVSQAFNNNFIQNAGISTLSEFVGSQFSIYMTSLINSALSENGLISGIDFDLNLINNSSSPTSASDENSLLPSEIQVRLKNKFRFLDERLSVNVGGNYVRQNNSIGINDLTNYLVPEFYIEYALTKDRQLNLKLYGKYDVDEIEFGRRQKFGVGLRYRSEFGSIRQTKAILSDAFKNNINKGK